MYFTKNDIDRITKASKGHLLDVAQVFMELRKSGVNYVCDCPHCGVARKFSINPNKEVFGCFSCHEVNGAGCTFHF